jgi:hypothetical protein
MNTDRDTTAVPTPPWLRLASTAVWLPFAFAILVLAVTGTWLATTSIADIRELLRVGQFWFLDGLFAALMVAASVSARSLAGAFTRLGWHYVATIAAASLLLVMLAPATNRIYYDEQIYQSIGQNLSDLHLAQACDEGTVEYGLLQCARHAYNKQPYGYPYLLSLGYRLFGTSDQLAHWMNTGLSVATAIAAMLIATLLTGERRAGLFAALALSVIPEQLLWARTAASEPATAFFCALAVLAAVVFTVRRSMSALLWTVFTSAFVCYFRPEALLILPVIGATVAVLAPDEIGRRRFLWCSLLGLVLLLPELAHLAAVRNESWGAAGDPMSAAFLWNNLKANGVFYIADGRFPATLTFLAGVGLSARSRAAAVCLIWFALFWGVYLFFYAGSYNYGADVRYSVITYPPLAVLAGVGASRLTRLLGHWAPRPAGLPAVWVTAAIAFQLLWYLPRIRAVGEEAWAARADVAFARRVAATLPPNAIVLTHNPSMFQLWGVAAAQLSIAAAEPTHVRADLSVRYAGGVYLHWNFWCNVSDPVQVQFCEQALSAHPSTLVGEWRERDYRFAFYRVGQITGQ